MAEAEQGLAHAALGDLFEDVLEIVVPALSAPRRRALEVALLVEQAAGRSVDPRTLGVAVRNAVEVLAGTGRLFSRSTTSSGSTLLGGRARVRDATLGNEPVFLLLARRVGDHAETSLERALDAERVERLPVGPLSLGAIHRLLRSRLDCMFGRSTLLQVYETSGGNPLRPRARSRSPSGRRRRQWASRFRFRRSSRLCSRGGSPTSLPTPSRC